MKIEEERQDVLQNLEFAVARLYRRNPEMKDYAVLQSPRTICWACWMRRTLCVGGISAER